MAVERKKLGKKLRFEIFKRDGFRCQYCGNSPPGVVLELDHIVPLASGGTDAKENLTTACVDCNRGKGCADLQSIPESVVERTALLQEREEQLRAFHRLLAAKRRRESREVAAIEAALLGDLNRSFAPRFVTSVRTFLGRLPFDTVENFALLAASRVGSDAERRIRYFCGCCWREINGDDRNGRYRGS